MSPKTLTLTAGGATGTITATVSPANATNKNVTWTSSNEAVATVVNGVVTPVSAGTATITATTVDGGKTASTTVIIGDLLVEEGGSIQAAIDDATAGDVIIVGDGDYTENLTINKAITLKSLNGSESTKIAGTITIVPLDDEKLQDVTVEGFTVTAPAGYKVYPVIHMNNLENVNILNNSVVADDTAYGAIGTSDGPAKVTGIISGNTVTGMIIVGTDGDLEVSDNNVKLTPASTEGICFYPVGSTAVITVTGNTVGDVTEGNVQIKVNEKPLSVNGENSELDMLAAITADNNEATAKLGWFTLADSTVAVIGATQYDTLRTAIDAAEEGDTIFLLPGEIHEGTRSGEILSFNLPLNMQNITIKGSGAGDSGTVFKDMTITHNHNGLAPYSFYDGLMFDSIRFENTAICLENRTWSATGHQFKDIAIKNCMFINCSGRAGVGAVYIDAQYNAGNFTFENNTVDNIVDEVGGAAAVILNPFNGNITIEGNEFKNMTEHRPLHIKFDLGNGGDDVIVVKDNTFIDNSRGILIREYGSGDDKTTINVNNNIFANTGDTNVLEGIRIDTAADGLSISGNTFTGLAEAVGFTAAKDTEANFLALKANIIENNTGATDANVTAYGTFMGDLTAYNAALEAVVEDDYTAESWGAYQAVVDANEVTEENTQAEIDAATSNINAAQEYLVLATVKNITKGLDYDTIQAAIDDAVAGNNVIKVFPGDYGTASINIIQKEGVNITLEAVGEVVLNNQIIIDGEARAAGTESLTIKGFTFDFTDAIGAVDIISTTNRLSGQSYNYSHNVTIEDNIFNGTFDATVVAIRSQSSYNLKIIGCRGEGLFSLGQITSIPDELEVRDCDVTVSEGGINYTGAGNVTIEALKVVGELYGVRAGANNEVIYSGSKLVISGSDLEAKYPVIIRGAAETVTITDSTLTPIDDGEMINNVANGNINITIDGATYITDANNLMELQNALGKAGTGDQTVMFAKDAIIDMTSQTWTPIKVDGYHGAGVVTIDGNGATLTNLSAPLFAGGFAGDSGIVIKNLTIADSEITSKNLLGSGAFIESIDSMPTITLENCALKNSSLTGSRTGGLIGWTAGYSNVNDGPVKTYITIRDCTVERNEITGTGTTGGIIGQAGANDWTYHTIENTIVTNNTITSINNENKGVASIVGTVNVGEVTITNYQANENTVNWTTDHGSTPNEKVYGRLAFGETGKLIIDGVDITE